MSFQTTLFEAIEAADTMSMGDYRVENHCHDDLSEGCPTCFLDLSDNSTHWFADQDIEVEEHGYAWVPDINGEVRMFLFEVARGLCAEDISQLKKGTRNDAAV